VKQYGQLNAYIIFLDIWGLSVVLVKNNNCAVYITFEKNEIWHSKIVIKI